eukprot:g33071.t1
MSASSNTSTKEPAATNLGRESKSKGERADTLEQQSPASGNSSAQRDGDAARVLEVSQELKASSKSKSGDSRKNEQRLVYNVRLLLSLLFVKQGSNAYKEKNTMGKVGVKPSWGYHKSIKKNVVRHSRSTLQLAASLEMFQLPRQLAASKAPNISIEEVAAYSDTLETLLESRSGAESLQLVARARQFSCFILLLGTLSVGNAFEPKHGIIVQNKGEAIIPLLLEPIPSAKAFKDAIASLSPERQSFAKAFRAMQLSSSVFGLCVVQIKPQLELLLQLDADSLTKEIALTQLLLDLFLNYQIPPISYPTMAPWTPRVLRRYNA